MACLSTAVHKDSELPYFDFGATATGTNSLNDTYKAKHPIHLEQEHIMSLLNCHRFVYIYSGLLTVVLAVMLLCGFGTTKHKTEFDEIDVHRINVVEPDGTPRMIISNEDKRPGSFFQGQEHARPDRKGAGMYFYNNEGTEAGGLIYGSFLDKNGKIEEANVHLSFDQYNQDQIFSVDAGEERDGKFSMLRMNDVDDKPLIERVNASERISKLPAEERQSAWAKFNKTHPLMQTRVLLGRVNDKSAVLQLKDTEGHNRIVLKVSADGTPSIQLLDATGRVSRDISSTP